MEPTIGTYKIRGLLRLSAELGHIPPEVIPVIEADLGLDYVEEQFKKRYKHNTKCFCKALADLLEEYRACISFFDKQFDVFGDNIAVNLGTCVLDAHSVRNFNVAEAKLKRIQQRIGDGTETVEVAKAIIQEEEDMVKDYMLHGGDI